jgi:tRNA G10  N-methylase Trm11
VGDEELPKSLLEVDMVITDLPYGKLSRWEGPVAGESFVKRFLEKLRHKLGPVSVAAVIHDRKQPISHPGYKAIRSFALGKRKIVLLEPESNLAR